MTTASPASPSTEGGRRPTIREVARLAGVSHQTVSRYLKHDMTVNEQLGERIREAVEELDYRPNLVARAMRNHQTGRLAIMMPAGSALSSLHVLTGAKELADAEGYVLEVVTVSGSAETHGRRALELQDSRLFEGVLALMPLGMEPPARPDRAPLVSMPLYDESMRGIGVLADGGPVRELVTGLAEQGHRRFLHLAGRYTHEGAVQRREVYLQTIADLGLESHGVVDCHWDGAAGRQAMLELPEDCGVTAVIAANDILAVAAVSGAMRRGWSVPGDVSITGWDNDRVAEVTTPAMTTVDVQHRELGRRLMRHLLGVIDVRRGARQGDWNGSAPAEAPSPLEEVQPLHQVIWRESTGPAPALDM